MYTEVFKQRLFEVPDYTNILEPIDFGYTKIQNEAGNLIQINVKFFGLLRQRTNQKIFVSAVVKKTKVSILSIRYYRLANDTFSRRPTKFIDSNSEDIKPIYMSFLILMK